MIPRTNERDLPTEDLRLVCGTSAMLEADLRGFGAADVERWFDADPPPSWPPELFEQDDIERMLELSREPGCRGWGLWYLVSRRPITAGSNRGTLVGIIAYGGPPDADGDVTLGYSVIPEAQRRGFAAQATAALAEWAFRDPRTRSVSAETFAELIPSIGVLEKSGFQRTERAPRTPGAIRFVRRRE